jgi:hypothetical protein
MVFELPGLLDHATTDVITLSDYSDDTSDLQRSQAVASIKAAAEAGRTVLLTNAAPIASSIFDLLNRHYLKTTKVDQASGKVIVRYYANIAIGSYSRLCSVDPKFRIVVHVSAHQRGWRYGCLQALHGYVHAPMRLHPSVCVLLCAPLPCRCPFRP